MFELYECTGRENIALWLLEQGADPHKQTKNKKQTPLHLACEQGMLSIVRKLVKYMRKEIDIPDSSSCTRKWAVQRSSHISWEDGAID